MLEVGGAGCIGIEAHSGDQSARSTEKFFTFILQLPGWALVAP